MRGVGDEQEEVADLLGDLSRRSRELLLTLAQRPALGLGGGRLFRPAVLVELADLLRQGLDLVSEVVALTGEGPLPLVEGEHPVHVSGVDPAPRELGPDLVGLAADATDVQHDVEP